MRTHPTPSRAAANAANPDINNYALSLSEQWSSFRQLQDNLHTKEFWSEHFEVVRDLLIAGLEGGEPSGAWDAICALLQQVPVLPAAVPYSSTPHVVQQLAA